MFTRKSPLEKTGLEKARDDALLVLDTLDPTDTDYAKTITHVQTLSNLITQESTEKLNPNTVIMALANIGGILTIVMYEQKHIFASKAASFIGKLR